MTEQKTLMKLWSGDTRIVVFNVKDSDGNAQDLTSATAKFEMAAREGGTFSGAADVELATGGSGIEITDAAAGEVTVTIAASDTASLSGEYYWELEITDSASRVSTVAYGFVEIVNDLA